MKVGYKQTEIGVIPKDWDVVALGEGISLLSGHHILAQHCNTSGEGVPYLTGPADFPNGSISHTKFTNRPSTLCESEDILVTVKGSGSGTLVVANGVYCISRQLMAIRVKEWNKRFTYYSLAQNASKIKSASTGLIPGLSRSDILEQLLPLPRLPEQCAIAEALNNVNSLTGALDQLIAKKRDLKQAAMQLLLTGQARLPGFDSKWKTGQLISFVRSHNSGIYKKSELYGHGCNIVGVSDLYGIDCVDGQSFAQVPLSAAERAKYSLATNDLLYGESSLVREGIARTVYVTERGAGTAFAWHTRRYSVDQSALLSPYLYYYLQGRHARKHMMDQCIQTAITGINTAAYFGCPILIPSVPEQAAIAEVLTDMDAELVGLEQRLEKTCALKQAMMRELLSGRTRLI